MPEHFTRSTVSAAFYCKKCQRETQHRIDGGRKGPCLECIGKLELQKREAERCRIEGCKCERWAEQSSLFGVEEPKS